MGVGGDDDKLENGGGGGGGFFESFKVTAVAGASCGQALFVSVLFVFLFGSVCVI